MAFSLSDVDKRILDFLIFEGAQHSENEIAKRLRLSQTTVNYNLRALRENGVIQGCKYRVDPAKVGYSLMAWFLVEFGEKTSVDALVNRLLSNPNVFDVMIMTGHYDIILKTYFRSSKEVNGLVTWIGRELKGEISKISIAIVTDIIKLHQSFVGSDGRQIISEKEREILKCRLADPEITMNEIAKKTRLHRNTVAAHWNGLWKKKVLLKKSVVINPAYFGELGIDFKAVVLLDASIGKKEKAIEYFSKFKEVHELTSIAYHNDVLAVVRMKDLYSAYKFIKEANSKDFIAATETYPVFIAYTKKVEPS